MFLSTIFYALPNEVCAIIFSTRPYHLIPCTRVGHGIGGGVYKDALLRPRIVYNRLCYRVLKHNHFPLFLQFLPVIELRNGRQLQLLSQVHPSERSTTSSTDKPQEHTFASSQLEFCFNSNEPDIKRGKLRQQINFRNNSHCVAGTEIIANIHSNKTCPNRSWSPRNRRTRKILPFQKFQNHTDSVPEYAGSLFHP